MSPEQITKWAKKAGGCQLADYDCTFSLDLGSLTRFAALIRDMTLEEAADLVFKMANHIDYEYQWTGLHRAQDAIRKLKGRNK